MPSIYSMESIHVELLIDEGKKQTLVPWITQKIWGIGEMILHNSELKEE